MGSSAALSLAVGELLLLLLLVGGLLAGAFLNQGRAHTHVVPSSSTLALAAAVQRLHDRVEVDLPGPMVDGDAVRADADVPEALAAAEQLPGVHVAHRAQPGSA